MRKMLALLSFTAILCSHSPSQEEKNAAAIDILSQPTAIESFALATDAEFDTDIFKKGEKQRHSRAFEVYKGRTGINAPDLEEEVEDTFEQDLNDILNEESI